MKKETFFLESYGLPTQLACYLYLPDEGAPKAVVQLSHGMCEYILRYEPFCQFWPRRALWCAGPTIWATARPHRIRARWGYWVTRAATCF